MASNEQRYADSADDRLDGIVADYVRAEEDGTPPDRDKLLAEHPELASELRAFFARRDRMQQLVEPLRAAAARVLNVRCPHCHHAIELVDEARLMDMSCPTCGSNFSLVGEGGSRQFPGRLQRLGQFQLVDQVGIGQFGSVWKARDLTLERTVALKIPRRSFLSSEETELFLRDARLAAALNHPNIVPVHEVGVQDDTIYIVSEFIHGASLAERIRTKRLTHRESAELCVKVAGALHHAHDCGVVHRDLKPGNVMIDLKDEPHLVDFGLAKRSGDEITMTVSGQVLGTPAYMSPEQARGESRHVDGRADIYSLGVILFELLTGEVPFRGEKEMLIVQVLRDDPPPLRRLDSKIPRDLETVCLKCLRKEPGKRYPSARQVADDLQRLLDRQPIRARPVSHLEKGWMWCRRRPAVSSMAALLVALLLGAGLILREVQQGERAAGYVQRLLAANIDQVPQIVEHMAPVRHRVLRRLGNKDLVPEPHFDSDKQLRVSLARLALAPDDSNMDYLYDRLLTLPAAEFGVVCDALAVHRNKLVESLWSVARASESNKDRRFRACCALADLAPDNDGWDELAPFVADYLVSESPSQFGLWRGRLTKVSARLSPTLHRILYSEDESMQKRGLAADCLANFLADRPHELYELLMKTGEQYFRVFVPFLSKHHDEFVNLLGKELRDTSRTQPLKRDNQEQERLAVRQAVAAMAAFQIGRPELASAVLRHSSDPRARTRFVHAAARFGVDVELIIARLRDETDDSVRRALVRALGGYTSAQLSDAGRSELVLELLAIYRDDADAGLHGATEWLLRMWGHARELIAIQRKLQMTEQQRQKADDIEQWYVNTEGHTMMIVEAGDFLMGAPRSVPRDFRSRARAPIDRPQHRVRIGRTYAISSKEVTREQMERCVGFQTLPSSSLAERMPDIVTHYYQVQRQVNPGLDTRSDARIARDNTPIGLVSWYDAARYCNWLSQQEGIPEDQWCYLPNADGQYGAGMRIAYDALCRSGYRLPTEAEWEFACRAGTATSRYYGETDQYLPYFAWYSGNASFMAQPVGSCQPNDFGLFDMLGNLWEWCHTHYRKYPSDDAVYYDMNGSAMHMRGSRVIRGGGFTNVSRRVDSADRTQYGPQTTDHEFGFRVARTIVPAPHDVARIRWNRAQSLGRHGKWREAAEMLQEATPHLPPNAARWYHTNFVWKYLGELDRVNANCEQLLRRFGDTTDPIVAHLVAGASLQHPAREVTPQIEQILAVAVKLNRTSHFRHKGLMHYRQGNYAAAADWLSKNTHPNADKYSRSFTFFYLAMTRWQQGDEEGAREAFREADQQQQRIRQAYSETDYGPRWYDWVGAEAARREAEQLLGAPPKVD